MLIERFKNKNPIFDILPPVPKKNLLIELSNVCNGRCIFCANRKMTRKKGIIDPDFLERILNEAYSLGVCEVGFYTTGEPFCNPHLAEYVALAKSIGFNYIYITTNGALATPEIVKPVIDAGLDSIKFSINATNRKDYAFIHGKDDFNTVLDNLAYVFEYKQQLGRCFNVLVSYIETRFTPSTKQLLTQTFAHICDEVVSINAINQAGFTPEIDKYLAIENNEVDYSYNVTLPCYLLFGAINITYEGYATACCTDFQNYLTYADLNKVSLKEAWHNDTIKELRRRHLNKNVDGTLCSNCAAGTLEKPMPLCRELSCDFDEGTIFDDSEVKLRIGEHERVLK